MGIVSLRGRSSALTGLALVALSAAVLVGCGKKEAGAQPSGTSGVSVQVKGADGQPVQTREEDGLVRYSDEGPEIGTVFTNMNVIVRKGADNSSEEVGRIGPGTGVNKKARRGAFYLVEFPSGGPGQMKLGWLDQHEVTGTPRPVPTPTVTTTATATATTTAGRPLGRPPIRIPGK